MLFLSHAMRKRDLVIVARIRAVMAVHGLAVTLPERGKRPMCKKVARQIRRCDLVLVLLTSRKKRRHVVAEARCARRGGVPVVVLVATGSARLHVAGVKEIIFNPRLPASILEASAEALDELRRRRVITSARWGVLVAAALFGLGLRYPGGQERNRE